MTEGLDPVQYLGLARIAAAKCWPRGRAVFVRAGIEFDDVLGEARVALVAACARYDPAKGGGNVEAYLAERIRWGLGDWYRSVFGGNHGAAYRPTPILVERDETIPDPTDAYAVSDLLALVGALPPHEAVAEHGVTESRACQILADARKEIRRGLESVA
jgi:hypothetical protein